jgi:hypothetical protein
MYKRARQRLKQSKPNTTMPTMHHQNGRAEKKIRDLQELARTMILHAQQRWPNAINAFLWPFAIKMANDLSNRAPGIQSGISPIKLFSQVEMAPRVKHSHHISTLLQIADMLTKAQPVELFVNQRSTLMHWPLGKLDRAALSRSTDRPNRMANPVRHPK